MATAPAELGPNPSERLIQVITDNRLSLGFADIAVEGNGTETIYKEDHTLNNGQGGKRQGQAFVSMPDNLAEVMPGSYLGPRRFLEILYRNNPEAAYKINDHSIEMLCGAYVASESAPNLGVLNAVTGPNFALNIEHGATNAHAITLSEKAAAMFARKMDLANAGMMDPGEDPEYSRMVAAYQENLFTLMHPVLARESNFAFAGYEGSDFDVRIVEDCIASGDTIMGVLSFLEKSGSKLEGFTGKRVRIDVAVATAQSVLALQRFAEENSIHLELNVSHMAFSLSEGEQSKVEGSKARVHGNYITHTEQMLQEFPDYGYTPSIGLRGRQGIASLLERGIVFVVGDMGDASVGVNEELAGLDSSRLPWNKLRHDPYGNHTPNGAFQPNGLTPGLPVELYFTNGGYLMDAFNNYVKQKNGDNRQVSRIFLTAKRSWGNTYGVMLDRVDPLVA